MTDLQIKRRSTDQEIEAMGRFSQWIAGLLERDFYGRRDLYEPDEALERVAAYMEPGDADAAAQYAASLGSKE